MVGSNPDNKWRAEVVDVLPNGRYIVKDVDPGNAKEWFENEDGKIYGVFTGANTSLNEEVVINRDFISGYFPEQ